MKKDCLMQFKDVTRIEVIDNHTEGIAYRTVVTQTPVISFQDNGKTLKVLVNYRDQLDADDDEGNNVDVFDPMNMMVVEGQPYTFNNVKDYLLDTLPTHAKEHYYSSRDLYIDALDTIIKKLRKKTKDYSIDAWRIEVAQGKTEDGYVTWREKAE